VTITAPFPQVGIHEDNQGRKISVLGIVINPKNKKPYVLYQLLDAKDGYPPYTVLFEPPECFAKNEPEKNNELLPRFTYLRKVMNPFFPQQPFVDQKPRHHHKK